jgi:hypothetical protein
LKKHLVSRHAKLGLSRSSLQPTANTLLVGKILRAELAFEVGLFWKNRESLKHPPAEWHHDQNPHVSKDDSHPDANQDHLKVHWISRDSKRSPVHELRRRLPWVFALATPAKESNRPEPETKDRACYDHSAQRVSPDFWKRELHIDRPNVIETDADQDRDQRYCWWEHLHGGRVLVFVHFGTKGQSNESQDTFRRNDSVFIKLNRLVFV